jgi:prevent-host-death family protein
MIQVPLYEVKNDLSRYLRIAEKEDVVITRHGVPAGILIGFEDPEDWWEEALLRNPQFQARITRARQSARAGKGVTIEQLREELKIEPPTAAVEAEGESAHQLDEE